MLRRFLLAAALLAAGLPASAQSVRKLLLATPAPPSLSCLLLGGVTGAVGTINVGPNCPPITFTRASSATYRDATGTSQTAATNVARFDHTATGAPLGLLLEQQRTNSVRNGNAAGAVVGSPGTLPTNWGQANSSGLVANVVNIGTESGIPFVDLQISGTSTAGQNSITLEPPDVPASNAQVWTGSLYMKLVAGSLNGLTIFSVFDQNNSGGADLGALTAGAFTAPTGAGLATQRQAFTVTLNQATVAFTGFWLKIIMPTGAVNFTLRIGGVQLEQAADATSYIPTTSGAVTRAADSAFLALGPWFNPAAITMVAQTTIEGANLFGNSGVIARMDDGYFGNNRLQIGSDETGKNDDPIVYSGGVASIAGVHAVLPAGTFKIGATLQPGNFAEYIAGANAYTLTSSGIVMPIGMLFLNLAAGGASAVGLDLWLSRLTVWPRALTPSELQAATR